MSGSKVCTDMVLADPVIISWAMGLPCPVNLQCTLSFRQVGLNLRPVHLLTRLIIMRIICLDLAPKSDLISVVRFVSEDSFFINFLIILHD